VPAATRCVCLIERNHGTDAIGGAIEPTHFGAVADLAHRRTKHGIAREFLFVPEEIRVGDHPNGAGKYEPSFEIDGISMKTTQLLPKKYSGGCPGPCGRC